jgi:hypothetical protein
LRSIYWHHWLVGKGVGEHHLLGPQGWKDVG